MTEWYHLVAEIWNNCEMFKIKGDLRKSYFNGMHRLPPLRSAGSSYRPYVAKLLTNGWQFIARGQGQIKLMLNKSDTFPRGQNQLQ